MFKNFEQTLEDTKGSFICGICLNDLIYPNKCPFCSFTACEKCFEVFLFFIILF